MVMQSGNRYCDVFARKIIYFSVQHGGTYSCEGKLGKLCPVIKSTLTGNVPYVNLRYRANAVVLISFFFPSFVVIYQAIGKIQRFYLFPGFAQMVFPLLHGACNSYNTRE